MQLDPVQQSAFTVQPPQAATQLVAEQMKGGPPLPPPGLGTQGTALQQSAADAQACPAPTHCTLVHRGTPTLSGLQVSLFSQFPEQQSHDALHEFVASLHTSPLGLQPIGLRHT